MATRRPFTQFVESYRFWDVVTLWGMCVLRAGALDHLLGS
jgi:hypothetical protein